MKNIYRIIIAALLLTMTAACGKKPSAGTSYEIYGSWSLTDIRYTKAAQIGSETVEVELTFSKDGSFALSQKLGDGRFREYSGTWTLANGLLSGKYSDGSAWGTVYKVEIGERTLSMTPEGKTAPETYVYTRK